VDDSLSDGADLAVLYDLLDAPEVKLGHLTDTDAGRPRVDLDTGGDPMLYSSIMITESATSKKSPERAANDKNRRDAELLRE
jgi:hypothetical protein